MSQPSTLAGGTAAGTNTGGADDVASSRQVLDSAEESSMEDRELTPALMQSLAQLSTDASWFLLQACVRHPSTPQFYLYQLLYATCTDRGHGRRLPHSLETWCKKAVLAGAFKGCELVLACQGPSPLPS